MAKGRGKAASKKRPARKALPAPAEGKAVVLTKPDRRIAEQITEAQVLEAFDMMGIGAGMDERTKKLFVAVARGSNLNPLKRQIHAVERWNEAAGKKVLIPVTGYEVYIDRAEDSGLLHYWNIETAGSVEDMSLTAILTIKRKDWPKEWKWTVRYKEVKADGPVWKKEPTHQTEKVCISRGFRLCFRDKEYMRGLPLSMEEQSTIDEEEERPPLQEPKAKEESSANTGQMDAAEAKLKASAAALDAELDTGKNAAGSMAAERKSQETAELATAKEELSRLYKEIIAANKTLAVPYDPKELRDLVAAAKAAETNIEKLRSLACDWQIDFSERQKKEGS